MVDPDPLSNLPAEGVTVSGHYLHFIGDIVWSFRVFGLTVLPQCMIIVKQFLEKICQKLGNLNFQKTIPICTTF